MRKPLKRLFLLFKLILRFLRVTFKFSKKKNEFFFRYFRLLSLLLEKVDSEAFSSNVKFMSKLDSLKARANQSRYCGEQRKRDHYNITLAKTKSHSFLQGQRETARLLGNDFTKSFGHLSWGIGYRLKACMLGQDETKYVLLGNDFANTWLVENYWKDYLPVIALDKQLVEIVQNSHSHLFEDVETLRIANDFYGFELGASVIDENWRMKFGDKPLLELKLNDKEYGYAKLAELGYKDIDWFVTFHFRNRGNEVNRNTDATRYIEAIREIIKAGGFVFCVGDGGALEDVISANKYFDFGKEKNRDERLDIFLLAACRFFVGSSSGPTSIPPLFGKGVLWTNCGNLVMNTFYSESILIPKLRTRGESKLDLSNVLLGIASGHYENDSIPTGVPGLRMLENSADEIAGGVLEMLRKSYLEPISETEGMILEGIKARSGGVVSNRISRNFLIKHFG
jgi:putative glycosyltransferase (TIGR04372 family)